MGNLQTTSFPVGRESYRLSPWEQKQHNWFIVMSHLADDAEHNYRFYNDEYLLDLLDLGPQRENQARMALAKVYADVGNLAPYLVQAYKAMAMAGVTTDHIKVVDQNGDTVEAETKKLHQWLEGLNEGGFNGFLDEYMDGAATFGTGYVALVRDDATKTIMGICKDAMAVYPVLNVVTGKPDTFLVHYWETEAGHTVEEQWTEEYLRGEVNVYRGSKLVPEASGPTNINLLTMVGAPFRTMRGSYFGRGALSGLIESLVTMAGAIGTAYNTFRMQNGGIVAISSDDDISSVLEAMGGGKDAVNAVQRGVKRVLDPESPSIINGKNLSVTMVQGNVMASAQPLVEELRQLFAMRCPVYAWHRLGANASGEAIKQTMLMLRVEIDEIRRNVKTLIVRLAEVLSALYGSPMKGRIEFEPPDFFAPTQAEVVQQALTLFDKNLVPAEFVLQEAGLLNDRLVQEHVEGMKAKAEQQTAVGGVAPAPEDARAAMVRQLFGTEPQEPE